MKPSFICKVELSAFSLQLSLSQEILHLSCLIVWLGSCFIPIEDCFTVGKAVVLEDSLKLTNSDDQRRELLPHLFQDIMCSRLDSSIDSLDDTVSEFLNHVWSKLP